LILWTKSESSKQNFFSRQQKILPKFNYSNVIDANSESEDSSTEEEEVLDQDEIIDKNFNSANSLGVMWKIAKLVEIFKPSIRKKL
jgi:hypothetical protein